MNLRAKQRTFFKIVTQPHLVIRARKSLQSDVLKPVKKSCRFHYLRITKRNINFINNSMSRREKVYRFHYTLLSRLFDRGFVDLCCDKGATLWRSSVRPELSICLKQGNPQFRDGEIELQFRDASNIVYFMGFTLVPDDFFFKGSKEAILITRVQGSTGYLDLFKTIKNDLRDVAVNHLLFSAMRGLSAYMGISAIYGVSTEFQSYYTKDRFDRFNSTYNLFWESLQGSRCSDAFYQLPIPYIHKDILQISQHHRSRVRKKREFKDSILDSVFSEVKTLNPYAANRLSSVWCMSNNPDNAQGPIFKK